MTPSNAATPPDEKQGRLNATRSDDASAADRAGNGTARGDTFGYVCPVCGRRDANARVVLDRDGDPMWLIKCWSSSCDGNHLPTLAEAIGLDGGASKREIADTLREAHGAGTTPAAPADPDPLPTRGLIERWRQELADAPDALAYLTETRGLSLETIARRRIGFARNGTGVGAWPGASAFVLPVYAAGGERIVNLRRRFWPHTPGPKMVGPRGVSAALYPDVPDGRHLLVCEGEFDALLLRQAGLPAITSIAGAGGVGPLLPVVRGRRVAVLFDVGAEAAAERAAARLKAAGAEVAFAVDLPDMEPGEDVSDWLLTYNRTADDLMALVRMTGRAVA